MAKKSVKGRGIAWGGRRAGAGRKIVNPEGAVEAVSVAVPRRLMQTLDKWAGEHELNRSQAVTEAVRRMVKAIKRQKR